MLLDTRPLIEPAYDILRLNDAPLEPLFKPQSVALIGASGQVGTVGYTLLRNLINAPFHGSVVPITPLTDEILGIPTLPGVKDVPVPVDLAIVVSPSAEMVAMVRDCIAAKVKSVLLLSSGFRESGAISPEVWHQLKQLVKDSPLRLLGPNSLGIMTPRHGLNATLANALAQPGNIGFISQSGALCRAILNWSSYEKVGFSSVISMGSMLDIDWGDLIRHLGRDPYTQSIIIHMETLGNAQSFLAAAREVARSKPIILIKGGQTEAAMQAALSHTGEVLGSDAVFEAALRRCGVLRVHRISELFNMAEVLAKRDYQITGSRLSIITNSGGLGVLATDALIATGGQLADLTETTVARLNRILPAEWSHQNPVDILGDANGERFQKTVEIVAQDTHTDGMLVIFTPQGAADPTDTAERLKDTIKRLQNTPYRYKPVLASWMGGAEVMAGESLLNQHQIPTYPYPDSAARLFNLMGRHSYSLQGMAEVPAREDWARASGFDVALAKDIIQSALQAKQSVLSPIEAQMVLQAYNIPVLPVTLATSEDRAIAKAEEMGYPVVLKLPYRPGTHTPDGSGVQLNLTHAEAVRHAYRLLVEQSHSATVLIQSMVEPHGAYELMVSITPDEHFGPVLTFGKGGRLLEVDQDRAVALPPLTPILARRTIEQTRIFQALSGHQGYPAVNLEELETLLVNLSWLVVDQPWVRAVDINPLWVMPDWSPSEDSEQPASDTQQVPPLLVLDARIELHAASGSPRDLPIPVLRPYPSDLVTTILLGKDGQASWPVTLRPVGPQDAGRLNNFLERLGEQSLYQQRSNLLPQNPQERWQRLQQLCFLDYRSNIALLAERLLPNHEQPEILGLARLNGRADGSTAEFTLVVEETVQNRGLGTAMLEQLVEFARQQGMTRLETTLLSENAALQRVCQKLGCQFRHLGNQMVAVLDLIPLNQEAETKSISEDPGFHKS